MERLQWAGLAFHAVTIACLAASLFLLLRRWPEPWALVLFGLGALLFLHLFSLGLSVMDVSVEEQRNSSLPLHLLAMSSPGCILGSGALACASRHAWVKAAGVFVLALAIALVVTAAF